MSNWNDIDSLREQVNDYAEIIANLRQQNDALKRKVERLERPMGEEGLTKIGAEAALKIDDIYARGHTNVEARRKSVQVEVSEVVREVMTGTRHWSRGGENIAT